MYDLIKGAIKAIYLIIFFVVGSALGIDSTTWLILLAAFILWPFLDPLKHSLDNLSEKLSEKLDNHIKNCPPE